MDKSRRGFLGLGAAAAAGWAVACGRDESARKKESSGQPFAAAGALPPPIPPERHAKRREELAARMREEGYDFLLVTPGPALNYLTGAGLRRSERLIAFVLAGDGASRCLGPAFEKERLERSGLPGEILTWEETQDPFPLLAAMLTAGGTAPRIAVEGTTWFDDLAPLARRMPSSKISSATPLLARQRMRKDPDELGLMRSAISITQEAIRRVMQEVEPAVTEEELLGRAVRIASEAGASLQGLVQFGSNSAIPHAAAGATRLRSSDVILFDLVGEVHGYHSDISRTFGFGRAPGRFQEIYRTVLQAQEAAFRAIRPGVSAGSVDEAARSFLRKNGWGSHFTHRLGHGLGLEVHEAPYLVGGNSLALEAGMTVTVEPGIYLPGEFGVRLEDDVLVTSAGAEILSASSKPAA